jgi:hypothetical protein
MDDATAAKLIATHDGAAPAALSDRFKYTRRLVAAACGRAGHPGGEVSVDDAPTLLGVYASRGAGTLSLGTPEGLWAFALALVNTLSVSN